MFSGVRHSHSPHHAEVLAGLLLNPSVTSIYRILTALERHPLRLKPSRHISHRYGVIRIDLLRLGIIAELPIVDRPVFGVVDAELGVGGNWKRSTALTLPGNGISILGWEKSCCASNVSYSS
jgi:hypothetical protein